MLFVWFTKCLSLKTLFELAETSRYDGFDENVVFSEICKFMWHIRKNLTLAEFLGRQITDPSVRKLRLMDRQNFVRSVHVPMRFEA